MACIFFTNNEFVSFNCAVEIIDFIKLREKDLSYLESIREIYFYSATSRIGRMGYALNIIVINNGFFDNMKNLEKIDVSHDNIVLPQNAFVKNYKLKKLNYYKTIPNLNYLGFTNSNVLTDLTIASKSINKSFFCECRSLEYLCVISTTFVGNCFENVSIRKELYISCRAGVLFDNFELVNTNLKKFGIDVGFLITNNCKFFIPNLKKFFTDFDGENSVVSDILKNSHRVKHFFTRNEHVHISELFSKEYLKDVTICNANICFENIEKFENNKNLKELTIFSNKKIFKRDLGNKLSGITYIYG